MDAPLALYRRYRPDTFAEVIGQDHVTAPLRNALSNNRVNHAYLFSGPRGCGKTTSARILARAINCEKGPIAEPCGVCQSCQDLARGGPGSIDVIEIDAASHGGVDDARDLRERAFFSPVQSRYKIYIIDEAHMVTTQGFNALLKLVEEPPPHLKFIFATTEPDKVIGTIRSRTHHYPFRLVPPKVLAEYMAHLCEVEGVTIAPAALPLVVRAGAGSVRDSLSVLDQLIGGADADGVTYQLTVSLLGFTPDSLLDACVDGFAAHDSGAVFEVIDKVIETGQDPKRFAEDLLRRLRDLVVLSAVPSAVATGLIEVAEDQGERLQTQAAGIGPAELTRAADIVAAGLLEMRGATAPRLQLELICAKVLLPGADDSTNGIQARLDRIERRLTIGVPAEVPAGTAPAGAGTAPGAAAAGMAPAVPAAAGPAAPVAGSPVAGGSTAGGPAASGAGVGGASAAAGQQGAPAARSAAWPDESGTQQATGSAGDSQPASGGRSDAGSAASGQAGGSSTGGSSTGGSNAAGSGGHQADGSQAVASQDAPSSSTSGQASPAQATAAQATPPQATAAQAAQAASAQAAPVPAGGGQSAAVPASSGSVGLADVRRLWPEILEAVKTKRRFAWIMLSQNAQVIAIDEQTITLGLVNAGARESFARSGSDEILRQAMVDTIGLSRRVEAVVDPSTDPGAASAPAAASAPPQPNPSAWDQSPPAASAPAAASPSDSSPAAAPSAAPPSSSSPGAQAGDSQPGISSPGGSSAGSPQASNSPGANSPAGGGQRDSAGQFAGGQSSSPAAVGQSSSGQSATGHAPSGQTGDGPPSAGQVSGASGSNDAGANGTATNGSATSGTATNRSAPNGSAANGSGTSGSASGLATSGAEANGVGADDPRRGGQAEHSPAAASTAGGFSGPGPVTGLATGQQAGGPPAPAGTAEGAEQRREPAASKWRAAEATVAAERAKRAAQTTQVEAPLTPEEEAEAIGEDDVVLEDDSRSHTELLRETLGAQIITEEPN